MQLETMAGLVLAVAAGKARAEMQILARSRSAARRRRPRSAWLSLSAPLRSVRSLS